MKDDASLGKEQLQKITDFADKSEDKLLIIQDSRPLAIKRDTLVIGRNKLSIIERRAFNEELVTSINIADILNVTVSVNALLGTISLYTKYYSKDPLQMKSLSRKNALLAKRLIQGLLVCRERKIDINKIPRVELLMQLERIGKA